MGFCAEEIIDSGVWCDILADDREDGESLLRGVPNWGCPFFYAQDLLLRRR
jgi:hypothetical protein